MAEDNRERNGKRYVREALLYQRDFASLGIESKNCSQDLRTGAWSRRDRQSQVPAQEDLCDALRDPPRHISPLVPGLVIVDLYDSSLLFEDPANSFLTQSPKMRNLVDRVVLLERIACRFVLDCLRQFPGLQGAQPGIQSQPGFH